MKRKQLISIIAALVLSFTLVGCGETGTDDNSSKKDSEPTTVATEAPAENPTDTPAPTEEPKVDARPLLNDIIDQYKTMYETSSANLVATADQLKTDMYPTFAKFEAGQEDFNNWVAAIDSDIATLRADSIDLMIEYLELMKEYHAEDTTELGDDNVNFCEQVINDVCLTYWDTLDAMVLDYSNDYINNEIVLLYADEEAYATYGSYLDYEPHLVALDATYSNTLSELSARLLTARNENVLSTAYAMLIDLFYDGENSVAIIDSAIEYLESQK